MSSYTESGATRARILQGKGDAIARGHLQRGQIIGQSIATIADIAGNLPQQILQARAQDQKAQKEAAITAVFKKHGDNLPAAISEVMQIDPTLGMEFGKRYQDAATAAFNYKTAKWKAGKDELDYLSNLIGSAKDQDSYTQALVTAKLAGIDVSKIPPTYDPAIVEQHNRTLMTALQRLEAGKPKEPTYSWQEVIGPDGKPGKQYVENTPGQFVATPPPVLTPDQAADNTRQERSQAETERHNRATEAAARASAGGAGVSLQSKEVVNDKGQRVMANFNPKTGKYTDASGAEIANPQPSSGTSKPASGLEKRALNFFNRARQADGDLEALEEQIQGMSTAEQYRMQYAPNIAQSGTGQSYVQAQRAFTEARLRKDSGAAIPDQEFKNDRQTYFAQPGDSKATLEQKRRARAAVLASLGFESGQALGEFEGDGEAAKRIVDDYKARSGKGAAAKKADPLGIR